MSSDLSHRLPRRVIIPGERGVPPPPEQIAYIKLLSEENKNRQRKTSDPWPFSVAHASFVDNEALE